MGASAGPDIVENGLVLALDAADRNSYPGSGTTWTDLSGNDSDGTLVSAGQYNSGGWIDYGGNDVNTETTASVNVSTSGNTIEQIIYANTISVNGHMPFTFYNVSLDTWLYNDQFGINNGSSLRYGISGATSIFVGKWVHYAVYIPNWTTATYTQAKLWINGVSQSMSILAGSVANRPISSPQTIGIGGGYTNGANTYNFDGRISLTRIYNRELSSSEIQQNFNMLRGRFGI
jgi:hypothetical protein